MFYIREAWNLLIAVFELSYIYLFGNKIICVNSEPLKLQAKITVVYKCIVTYTHYYSVVTV